MSRLRACWLAMVVLAGGCTATAQTISVDRAQPSVSSVATSEPVPEPVSVVPVPPSEPTVEQGSGLVDDSEILVQGDGWVTTQNELDALAKLVEEAHGVSFTDPVGVEVSDDIGREFAARYEPFRADDWIMFQGLGLATSEAQRLESNQLRLDRIRGFCCTTNERGAAVVVELQDSKFATDLIIVHELVHAIHNQHPDLRPQPGPPRETPYPAAAAFEGVPQFVAFDFMMSGSEQDQAAVTPDLPIIPDSMLDQIPPAASRHLNFAYATGPAFVAAVVRELGAEGFARVLQSPPTTTEQVLFPQKYLAGEIALPVESPTVPPSAEQVGGGTIGAAMLWFLLAQQHGDETALSMVEPWAGDTSVIYELDNELCLAAMVAMDSGATTSFGVALRTALLHANGNARVDLEVRADDLIDVTVCHQLS